MRPKHPLSVCLVLGGERGLTRVEISLRAFPREDPARPIFFFPHMIKTEIETPVTS